MLHPAAGRFSDAEAGGSYLQYKSSPGQIAVELGDPQGLSLTISV